MDSCKAAPPIGVQKKSTLQKRAVSSHHTDRILSHCSRVVCQDIYLLALLFSNKTVKYREEPDHTCSRRDGAEHGLMEVLQLSWKRRKAELQEVGPVCFVIKDHVAGRRPSPSPVTTDSTVSSCCSGQLLQNGCTISAADEKALNVRGKVLFIRVKARRDTIGGPSPLFGGIYELKMAAEMRAKNIFS